LKKKININDEETDVVVIKPPVRNEEELRGFLLQKKIP
jgi:hypothetical protein